MKRLMLGVKAQGFGLQGGWGLNFWGSRAVVFTCVLGLREPMASVFAEAVRPPNPMARSIQYPGVPPCHKNESMFDLTLQPKMYHHY